MNGACPTDELLEGLLAERLEATEERALEAHVVICPDCQRRLDELTRMPSSFLVQSRTDDARGEDSRKDKTFGGLLARLAQNPISEPRPTTRNPSRKRRLGSSSISFGSSTISASSRFVRRQIWVWPLIVALLLGGLGWWVSRSVESAMRRQRVNELTTVLNADVTALRLWMENQKSTAQLVADDETLRSLSSELLALADGSSADDRGLVGAPAQQAIRSRLAKPLQRGGFTGFLLVSSQGVVLSADEDAPLGASLSGYRGDFFVSVIDEEAAVSKPFLSPLMLTDERGERRAELPCMYAAAPIRDSDGRALAAIGLRIRPEGQFTQILHVARPGLSGETYAFDRRGVLLSQSRFDEELKRIGLLVDRPESKSILTVELRDPGGDMTAGERPTIRRSDQPLTRMADEATRGSDGHDVDGYRDYRGVPVVGAWQWLDEYDFAVATEMDVREAFAPAYALRRAFAVLMGLLALAAGAILATMLLLSRQRRQLLDANLAAMEFGQYKLVEKLGAGGMGTVYKARHARLRRPTAIKLLKSDVMSDSAIARFEREVQLTSELTHPNTVAIYDFGRTSEGVLYYAMEYLEGVDLEQLVRRYGPLPEARVRYLLAQVCASLAEAHAAGLVHRDVKPANVFLTERGGRHDFVKVLDFGLAKATVARDLSLTATNTIAGSPLYVSPEAVAEPARVDARADVYGIGLVGYYLLTGTPVFGGSSAESICLMHVGATPQPPSLRADRPISPELEALLMTCLAKSPVDRPQDAADLSRLLENCAVEGNWTAAIAADWWRDRRRDHSAATQVSAAKTTSG